MNKNRRPLFFSMEKSHRPPFYSVKKVTAPSFHREKCNHPFFRREKKSPPLFPSWKSHPLWQMGFINSLFPTTQMLLLTKPKKVPSSLSSWAALFLISYTNSLKPKSVAQLTKQNAVAPELTSRPGRTWPLRWSKGGFFSNCDRKNEKWK